MCNETGIKEPISKSTCANPNGGTKAFWLVVIMLGILFLLPSCLLALPLIKDCNDKFMDYYKWTLSALLGAFGAWIGAGAAYFFGKENLQESSRSTESAMRIQQEFLRRPSLIERIKDMTLTAMNPKFVFHFDAIKGDVKKKLDEYKGYWFVPVVDEVTGVLKDIIHAQVFWDATFNDTDNLKVIVSEMDKRDPFKKLHGDLFYVKVSPNDKIRDVYEQMGKIAAEVAIVVDEKGIATHCVTKTELRTFLNVQ